MQNLYRKKNQNCSNNCFKKLIKIIGLSLCLYLADYTYAANFVASEATSFFKSIFASKGKVNIEDMVFEIDEDMNESGAISVYLVICYDRELFDSIKRDTASQFKKNMETYKDDYLDKIVILKWNLVAKKRLSPPILIAGLYERKDIPPVGGFIFATYSTPGSHRYRIPSSWKKMKVRLMKKRCKLQEIRGKSSFFSF